jgi:ABC-2 type transport system ATP-binding protein
MQALLEVDNLVKKFGDFAAVKGVSFFVAEGEIFSLLGPNGAGKTTTISMLSTLYESTSGDATVGGHSVTREPMAVRKLIGVVPQDLALYDDLTARENLNFWGQMYGLTSAILKTRIAEVLDLIGLSDRANQRVKAYSGGMKRRVNIGVGLLHRPRLLFMDEPTVGIDPQSRRAILDSVKELNKAGMTVLYTTHYMEEAQELSDRVGIIDHGELIAIGTQAELTQQIGQMDSLVLSFGEDQDAAGCIGPIQALPGVQCVDYTDHKLNILTPSAESILGEVVSCANASGLKIRTLEIVEPNLEAVFLSLTGRALRD